MASSSGPDPVTGWRRKGRRDPQGRAEALQLPVNVHELRRFNCCVGVNVHELRRFNCCVGGLCNES
jgi:hypothetical protein